LPERSFDTQRKIWTIPITRGRRAEHPRAGRRHGRAPAYTTSSPDRRPCRDRQPANRTCPPRRRTPCSARDPAITSGALAPLHRRPRLR
jgi:hypothetical protein